MELAGRAKAHGKTPGLMEKIPEDPLRGWSGAERGVGTARGGLEWGEPGWKVPRAALARRKHSGRELFQASNVPGGRVRARRTPG